MKNHALSTLLTALLLLTLNVIVPTSILAQTKSTSKTRIKIEDLTQEILEAPKELSDDKVKFFDFRVKTLSEVSVNLYDESKKKIALVNFKATSPDTTLYEIQSLGKKEFVQIKKSENNGKIFADAVSSNGNVSRIAVQVSTQKSDCGNIQKVLSFDIANGDVWQSFSPDSKNDTGNGLESLKGKLKLEDEKLYDTPQLQILRDMILNFTKLQQIVSTKSLPKSGISSNEFQTEESGCNVICYRMGSILAVFYCEGGRTNSCSCSAGSGAFVLSGCGLFCSVPCTAFYTWASLFVEKERQPIAFALKPDLAFFKVRNL